MGLCVPPSPVKTYFKPVGLRVSGGKRDHKIEGDAPWTRVRYSLTNELDEVELVRELRATKGEASFDEGSLRLVWRKE